MTPGSHARGDAPATRPRRALDAWRLGTATVVLLCGALFVVSAANSEGTDLRPGRYTDLASLARTEAEQYAELERRVKELDAEVDALTEAVDDDTVKRIQRKVERMEDPAGLAARSGPGVTVTLSDAPADLINSTTGDLNLLVVHQQDIQAVVNAMWKGGATAVTIQGQRVVSTTGIKCEGNSVTLQGVPYPQPYEITAVGNQAAILESITADNYLEYYRADAADPEIAVGWQLELEDNATAPAFDGLLDITYAEPIR